MAKSFRPARTVRTYRARGLTLINPRRFPSHAEAYRTMAGLYVAGQATSWVTYRGHRCWMAAEVTWKGKING